MRGALACWLHVGRRIALLALGLCGCMSTYQSGTLLAGEGHQGRRLSCLDVDAELSTDDIGGAQFVPGTSPLLQVSLGNVCDHPVDVHFERLRYYGQWADGMRAPLTPFDPRAEIRAGRLDSWSEGSEKLQLDGPRNDPPSIVCVDVSAVEGAQALAGAPLCRRFYAPGFS